MPLPLFDEPPRLLRRGGALGSEGGAVPSQVGHRPLRFATATTFTAEAKNMALAKPIHTLTLGDVVEDFLARHAPRLEPRALETYRERLATWVLPLYGSRPLTELTGGEIEAWLAHLGRRKLAAATIRLTCTVFGAVLNDAVRAGQMPNNPLAGIAGRYRSRKKAERVYDARQMTLFLDAAEDVLPELAPTYAVMGGPGLRVGEARGLRPTDLNLDARTLRVDRQVHRDGRVAAPKFDSHRVVDLTASVVKRLTRALDQRRGQLWLFPDDTRKGPVSYAAIRVGIVRVARAAGLEPIPPKGFRHSAASILAAKGVSMEYIRRMLGHTDIRVTQRTYASHLPIERPRALDEL